MYEAEVVGILAPHFSRLGEMFASPANDRSSIGSIIRRLVKVIIGPEFQTTVLGGFKVESS